MSIHQAEREIKLFNKFIDLYPYPVDKNSVEKRKPPEPDILCKLHNGKQIAFEIVQCIDHDIARAIADTFTQKNAIHTELERLSIDEKTEFGKKLSDAYIEINYFKGISKDIKKNVIPNIFDFLLTLSHETQGEFTLEWHPELKGVVKSVILKRGVDNGPIFDIRPMPIWFSNPIIKQINSKLKKNYETKYDIELISYYDLQPELPENRWLPQLKNYLEANLKNSMFQRVYVYSVTENRIVYVYPAIQNEDKIQKGISFPYRKRGLHAKISNVLEEINFKGFLILGLVGLGLYLNIDIHIGLYLIATIIGLGLLYKSEQFEKAENLLSKLFIAFLQGWILLFALGIAVAILRGLLFSFYLVDTFPAIALTLAIIFAVLAGINKIKNRGKQIKVSEDDVKITFFTAMLMGIISWVMLMLFVVLGLFGIVMLLIKILRF